MTTEIFAPILPVKTFNTIDEVISKLKTLEKPLALYLFSKQKEIKDRVTKEISFGGGCLNDTIIHVTSHHQPFGGVGTSGMGRYHGFESFKTFSNQKTIVSKSWFFDISLRYHPFKNPDGKPPKFIFKL